MTVGLCLLELHLAAARSLKEKRMVLNRLKRRLQTRHNVSVAEVDHQDLWQRATLAVAAVGADHAPVENLLRAVEAEVDRELPGELVGSRIEFLG